MRSTEMATATAGKAGAPGSSAAVAAAIPVGRVLATLFANWRDITNSGTTFEPDFATGRYSLDLDGGFVRNQASVSIIPEPATYGLVLAGVSIGVALLRRRRAR